MVIIFLHLSLNFIHITHHIKDYATSFTHNLIIFHIPHVHKEKTEPIGARSCMLHVSSNN